MKNKLILSIFTLITSFALVLSLPTFAFAQTQVSTEFTPNLDPCRTDLGAGQPGLAGTDPCKTAELEIGPAIGQIIQFIFVVAVILALGFLVYGGIRWITSGGDKAGVETARNTIIAAIIGLIIVFLAYFILNLILNFLTGDGIDQISIPSLKTLTG